MVNDKLTKIKNYIEENKRSLRRYLWNQILLQLRQTFIQEYTKFPESAIK